MAWVGGPSAWIGSAGAWEPLVEGVELASQGLTLGQPTASVSAGCSVALGLASLSLAGPAASVSAGVSVALPAAGLTLGAPAAGVSAGASVAAGVAGLTLTGPAVAIGAGVSLALEPAGVVLAGSSASVSAGASVALAAAGLALGGPAVVAGSGEQVLLAAAGLALSGPAAAVSIPAVVELETAALRLFHGGQGTVLVTAVADGADDGWVRGTAGYFPSGTYCRIGHDGYSDRSFFRFAGLDLPRGAAVTAARLTLHGPSYAVSAAAPAMIYAHDADDSARIASYADYVSRYNARTSASVAWSPGAWAANAVVDTPDLTAVVQEVADRPGWAAGNALQFLIENTTSSGYRDIQAYESGAAKAAILTVTHDAPSVSVTAGTGVALGVSGLTLAGPAASIPGAVSVALEAASLALAGPAATVSAGCAVELGAGLLWLSGPVPEVFIGATVELGADPLTLTGPAVQAGAGEYADLEVAGLALTGPAATVSAGASVALGLGSLTLAGPAAEAVNAQEVGLGVSALALSGPAAGVSAGCAVALGVAALELGQPGAVAVVPSPGEIYRELAARVELPIGRTVSAVLDVGGCGRVLEVALRLPGLAVRELALRVDCGAPAQREFVAACDLLAHEAVGRELGVRLALPSAVTIWRPLVVRAEGLS